MFQFDRVPDLETPEYTLLTRRADYEARARPRGHGRFLFLVQCAATRGKGP